ncbi:hypothetical protein F4802DRAFT_415900 [Xylaria palmicola]|nr:hypothetical protein F4802DRAFT_415900 [Xylaria palmicola]
MMISSRMDKFHRMWEKQKALMDEGHRDECEDYMREMETKKKSLRDKAAIQADSLRIISMAPDDFERKVCDVYRERNAALQTLQKEFDQGMHRIKEVQQKDQENHTKAYSEATDARSFLNTNQAINMTSNSAAAATGPAATESTGSKDPTGGFASFRSSMSKSPAPVSHERKPLAEYAASATTVSSEQTKIAEPKNLFASPDPPLRECMKPQAEQSSSSNTSSDPLPTTSIPAAVAAEEELGVSRTITFEEVYQNGLAQHKDTIVNFPPGTDLWYILKCEEHQMRFGRRPLMGAGKHLTGRAHDCPNRQSSLSIEKLGYRVIGCNKQLADLNNDLADKALTDGYVPEKGKKRRYSSGKAKDPCETSASSLPKRRKPNELITNPKPFHIYHCYWKPDRRRYPVMILGWDDQKPGGLEYRLGNTELLGKKTCRPKCYQYKDADNNSVASIVGWSPGYEDGGPRVKKRKFPAMFLFPLYKPYPPQGDSDPYNVARRWIATKEGFNSWEEFEKHRKGKDKGKLVTVIKTPSVSSLSGTDDSASEPDNASTATDRVLQEIAENAGEIDGDSDYVESGRESNGEDEPDKWTEIKDVALGQVEADGRPWEFYCLRNKASSNNQGSGKSAEIPERDMDASNSNECLSVLSELLCRHTPKPTPPPMPTVTTPVAITPTVAPTSASEPLPPPVPTSTPGSMLNPAPTFTPAPTPIVVRTTTPVPTTTGASAPTPVPTSTAVSTSTPAHTTAPTPTTMSASTPTSEPTNTLGAAESPDPIPTPGPGPEPVVEAMRESTHPGVPAFQAKMPLGPAVFELSSYSKGAISWSRESEDCSVKLYYGEDGRTVGTMAEGPLQMVIDPTTLRAITKKEIPESKGNFVMTLLGKEPDDAPAKVVFDRPRGSKADIGKIQSRSFIRWLRRVSPTIPLLDG